MQEVQTKGGDRLPRYFCAPMVKWPTIRIIVVVATKKGWSIKHLEIKTAFLNGDLEEHVHMEIPQASSFG